MTSFEQLFESVRPRLVNLAMALTGDNRDESEDLVQECGIRAFQKFDSFLDLHPFEPWVRRMLVRLHLNGLCEEKELSLDQLIAEGFDAEAPSAMSEECFALLDAVRGLPEPHLTVVFAVVEGGSWDTSADRMRRKRAMEELKAAMQP